MVEAVARMAKAAGAPCHMDPFVAQTGQDEGRSLLQWATAWLTSDSPPLVPDQARTGPARPSPPRAAATRPREGSISLPR
jgi:hypothetical protein